MFRAYYTLANAFAAIILILVLKNKEIVTNAKEIRMLRNNNGNSEEIINETPIKIYLHNSNNKDISKINRRHLQELSSFNDHLQLHASDEREHSKRGKDSFELHIHDNISGERILSCRRLSVLGGYCPIADDLRIDQYTSSGLTSNTINLKNCKFTTSMFSSIAPSRPSNNQNTSREYEDHPANSSNNNDDGKFIGDAVEPIADNSCIVQLSNENIMRIKSTTDVSGEEYEVKKCQNVDVNESSTCLRLVVDDGPILNKTSKYYDGDEVDVLNVLGNRKTRALTDYTDQVGENYIGLWNGCYPGIDYGTDMALHTAFIGISVGSQLFAKFNFDLAALMDKLERVLSDVNIVYTQQLGIKITLRHLEIVYAEAKNPPQWNNVNCKDDISTQFVNYAQTDNPSQQMLWHLMDDCYDSQGIVGKASIGTICRSTGGKGISMYVSNTFWLTVAHEMGHNFGMFHSFERGVGKTGGIMDYGDGSLDGIFQFNRKYRYEDLCGTMQDLLSQCLDLGVLQKPQASCGNGVVDSGEECECDQGQTSCDCCSNCKLRIFAECDPLNNDCCSTECKFLSAESSCTTSKGNGYCRQGLCQTHFCDFCGVQDDNPCGAKCTSGATCEVQDINTKYGLVQDDALCSSVDVPDGQCASGVCIQRVYSTSAGDQAGSSVGGRGIISTLVPVLLFVAVAFAFGLGLVIHKKLEQKKREEH